MNKFPFSVDESLPSYRFGMSLFFPEMVIPLFVGREKSVQAIEMAVDQTNKQLLLVAQHESDVDDPADEDLYDTGTLANILQMLKLPDGTLKILVEGQERVSLENIQFVDDQYLAAGYQVLEESQPVEKETEVLLRALKEELATYAETSKKIPREVLASLNDIKRLPVLVDSVAMHLSVELAAKQEVLETPDVVERAKRVLAMLDIEADVQQVEKKIRSALKSRWKKVSASTI